MTLLRLLILLPLTACDPAIAVVGRVLETGYLLAQPGSDQARPRPAPGVVTKPEPAKR